ncbi:hypothetical protein M1310_00620 [Candidatus Marsarchaeota archaeon]|nr:hypothetical protein [Candidatus Marsarchaeota archaeon]
MPYITYSKKGQELLSYCHALGAMFDKFTVQRRGRKSIKEIVTDSRSKGFSNIIIIGKSGNGAVATVIKTSKSKSEYNVSAAYSVAKSNLSMSIKRVKGAKSGEGSIIDEASD